MCVLIENGANDMTKTAEDRINIVTTIRAGHSIVTEGGTFLVKGSQKFRSGQKYICTDSRGRTVSLDREDVLQAQREGLATIAL